VHRSAYGYIAIPVVAIRNGLGPRVLLTAGNHGDEYEGQIVLTKLARSLEVGAVHGQIMILPMMNFPAAQAGMRTSPIDDGNLNRTFPGDPDGRPTAMIAHYVESVLMPAVDAVIDLHSGGSSLVYVPGTLARHTTDKALLEKILGLVRAFGAPNSYLMGAGAEDRSILAAAERAGILGLSAELGGAGMVTRETLAITERGVVNVLRHLGALKGQPEPRATRILQVIRASHYVYSPDAGSSSRMPSSAITPNPVSSRDSCISRIRLGASPPRCISRVTASWSASACQPAWSVATASITLRAISRSDSVALQRNAASRMRR
jgi:hypothetical protein